MAQSLFPIDVNRVGCVGSPHGNRMCKSVAHESTKREQLGGMFIFGNDLKLLLHSDPFPLALAVFDM